MFHSKLEKILAKTGLNANTLPGTPLAWREFLQKIEILISEFSSRQELLENTLGTSTMEMERLYLEVKSHNDRLEEKVKERTALLEKESARLKEAQNLAKIGSWEFRLGTRNFAWSSETYKIFEIEESVPSEMARQICRSRIPSKDLQMLDQLLKKDEIEKKGFKCHYSLVFSDGRNKNVVCIGKPILNERGEVEYFSGTLQDITEQIQREKDISFVLDSLVIGIWKFDILKNVLEWDKNMYQLYGVEPKDFSGTLDTWMNSLSPEVRGKAIQEYLQALSGEKEFDTTFQVTHKTGKTQEIRARAFVVRDQNGKPLSMHGINVDRNLEAALENSMALERAKMVQSSKLATLGEMAGGIAHEINNPLTIINGKAKQIKRLIDSRDVDFERVRTELIKIESTTERIAKIIRGLRSFSRNADADPMEKTKLKQILDDTLELCRERFKNHSIDLEINCSEEILLECRPSQISQILINLLSNSSDAIENLPEKWVSLHVQDHGESILISVTDSGTGIPSSIVERMMNPFFTTKEVGKGTGLGLSISKGIAQDHHGRLKYDPSSRNTRFILELSKIQPLPAQGLKAA